MSKKKPNIQLLREVLTFIKKYPRKHNQEAWCGTAKCFAGWACDIEGWKPVATNSFLKSVEVVGGFSWTDSLWDPAEDVYKGEMVDSTVTVATHLLGISGADARRLFHARNSVKELENMVDHLEEHGNLDSYATY